MSGPWSNNELGVLKKLLETMKHTQLIFVTFASLALAQELPGDADGKAMTQQEVSAKFQKWSMNCDTSATTVKGEWTTKVFCLSNPPKQGSIRKNNFASVCQKNGGCEKCYQARTHDQTYALIIGCDIPAQNNAWARPQETPKPQETKNLQKSQSTPQVSPQEVEKIICSQFQQPEDECHPVITQCIFEQKKKPDNLNAQKDYWKAVYACASKVLKLKGQ
ncbi:hypothetical protein X797_002850 [Metarhizium robertsii]|uniref:Uncharacterized protein n=1 Tax=Metarhizium robertsii TaxID=568076 RepID=A0A0A1V6H4_9HYPO|nr:hypothetical protein X797_002850 [Metarhizium robertsii]